MELPFRREEFIRTQFIRERRSPAPNTCAAVKSRTNTKAETKQNKNGGRRMQNTTTQLRPALAEVYRTAHDQDLVEVPKRARIDREAEQKDRPLPDVEPTQQNK